MVNLFYSTAVKGTLANQVKSWARVQVKIHQNSTRDSRQSSYLDLALLSPTYCVLCGPTLNWHLLIIQYKPALKLWIAFIYLCFCCNLTRNEEIFVIFIRLKTVVHNLNLCLYVGIQIFPNRWGSLKVLVNQRTLHSSSSQPVEAHCLT